MKLDLGSRSKKVSADLSFKMTCLQSHFLNFCLNKALQGPKTKLPVTNQTFIKVVSIDLRSPQCYGSKSCGIVIVDEVVQCIVYIFPTR